MLGARAYRLDERPISDQLFYRGNFLTTSAMVVRRSAILEAGGFDTRREYFTVEDYDLWLRLAEAGCTFSMVEETLGDYLVHPSGASQSLVRNYDNLMNVYDAHALARGRSGSLDVRAALDRRTRSRLAEVRDLARGGLLGASLRVLAHLPAERAGARRRYRASADAARA